MKSFYPWAVILLLMVSVNAAAAATLKDYQIRAKANPFMTQQRYDEAVKVYVDAAELMTDDDRMQAYCLTQAIAITLNNIKNEEAAFKLASQIRNPEFAASQRLYLLEKTKQYEKLLEAFGDTDISVWPLDIRMQSYASRAQAFIETDKRDKAEADLILASQTPGFTPVRLRVCYTLGQYYENQKHDLDKAVGAYELGMSITPANYAWRVHCFTARALIMLGRGQGKQLIEDYKNNDLDTVSSVNTRAGLYIILADAHISQNNFGQAATILTTVLRLPGLSEGTKRTVQDKLDKLASQLGSN